MSLQLVNVLVTCCGLTTCLLLIINENRPTTGEELEGTGGWSHKIWGGRQPMHPSHKYFENYCYWMQGRFQKFLVGGDDILADWW